MAIHEQKKQSDIEKRLQLLRRQVYGKQEFRVQKSEIRDKITTNSSDDLTYLNQDLLKILLFSSLAIGIQLILFFLMRNHIVNINF